MFMRRSFLVSCVLLLTSLACGSSVPTNAPISIDRLSLIPASQAKQTPETDIYPPKSFLPEYADPIPLPYPINTRGAEDSAFMMPDGNTLYVWFTPSPSIPPEKQVSDGATGIYVFKKQAEAWSGPERVVLQDPGKLALDGCEFILGNVMWFCSAREGYSGLHWFTAEFKDGNWQDWKLADFKTEYEVGELHITADGSELYFHSSRPGGQGDYDIWVSQKVNDEWQEPINLEIINSIHSDGWPFLTQDGSELWFTRIIGSPELWRSKRVNGEWAEPENMFGPFAGEASLDNDGNVYFTHHFYRDNIMLEADIYVAYRVIP